MLEFEKHQMHQIQNIFILRTVCVRIFFSEDTELGPVEVLNQKLNSLAFWHQKNGNL